MTLISPPSLQNNSESQKTPLRQRNWREKFRVAFRGIKFGIRGQSSFFVHFFFAALVMVAAIVLSCSLVEWCILLGCIGFVLVAELINTAIETLFRGLNESGKEKCWPALDIAAGAVLLARITAALICCQVFGYRLWLVLFLQQ